MAVSDITTLFFLSGSKWKKLWLLFVEQWRVSTFRLRKSLTRRSSTGIAHTQDQILRHDWHYTSTVPMSRELYEGSADIGQQDVRHSDGTLVTELDYQIVEVPNAAMVTNEINHRSVYDRNDRLMPELSFKKGRYKPGRELSMPIERHVEGLTASLYGTVAMADGNYGHWMIDGLSRLFLIQRHYRLSDFDHFLVPPLRHDFHRDSLLALGIPEHKIVEINALECLRFERLVATTSPRGTSSSITPGWMIDAYRKILLESHTPPPVKRRIYVSRKDAGSRKFTNEDEIIAMLERYGFESVTLSDYGFADKVNLFAEADMVAGLSGAGLTNVMFCPPGTTLIELQPSTLAAYMFASIATYLGFTVRPVFFDSHTFLSRANKYYGNLYIDPGRIEEQLLLPNRN